MSTKEAAERACKEPNPIIDGRKANVNLAILGAKPRGNALQSECNQISPMYRARLKGYSIYVIKSCCIWAGFFEESFVFVP